MKWLAILFSLLTLRVAHADLSVMSVSAIEGNRGTGFILHYGKGEVIVSNWHVCAPSEEGLVTIKNQRVPILATDKEHDLCLIKPPRTSTHTAYKLGPTAPPNSSVEIHNIKGEVRKGKYFKELTANIQYPSRRIYTIIGTTNIKIAHGYSGSPVLNESGEVVGVVNTIQTDTDYASFIPVRYLNEFLRSEVYGKQKQGEKYE